MPPQNPLGVGRASASLLPIHGGYAVGGVTSLWRARVRLRTNLKGGALGCPPHIVWWAIIRMGGHRDGSSDPPIARAPLVGCWEGLRLCPPLLGGTLSLLNCRGGILRPCGERGEGERPGMVPLLLPPEPTQTLEAPGGDHRDHRCRGTSAPLHVVLHGRGRGVIGRALPRQSEEADRPCHLAGPPRRGAAHGRGFAPGCGLHRGGGRPRGGQGGGRRRPW